MKQLFFLLTFWFAALYADAQTNIYGFSLDSAKGGPAIHFSAFAGMRVLIVETASADTTTFFQYTDLMNLGQTFKDSLVIVVVPTNSFGSEPLDSMHLDSLYKKPSGSNQYYISKETHVTGASAHPLFQWLSSVTANGVADVNIDRPFKKWLISRDGKLAGVYGTRVRPMDAILFEAVSLIP